MMKKLGTLKAAVVALMFLVSLPAAAQWPDRAVRIVVPYPPGGSADNMTRILARELTLTTGQTFLVENKPGGSGSIGTHIVSTAAPDGYTLGYGNINTLAINPALYRQMSYKPDDLVPVVETATTANLLLVRGNSHIKNLNDFLALARTKNLSMAYAGNGSTPHLAGVLLEQTTGYKSLLVPYKGGSEAMKDLLGGQVDYAFDNVTSAVGLVKSGQLRALAITAPNRTPLLKDVPTFRELGFKNMIVVAWAGIVVPKGTSQDVINKINAAVNKSLESSRLRAAMANIGAECVGGTSRSFEKEIKSEQSRWAKIIKNAHITVQ